MGWCNALKRKLIAHRRMWLNAVMYGFTAAISQGVENT